MKIKEIIKGIKLNIKIIKAIIKDRKNIGKTFTYDMVNEEGYIFDYAPATLAKFNISVAGLQIVKFGLFNYKPLFVYDDLYLELSEKAQEFIKHHELGHFNLHQATLLYGGGRVTTEEYEADAYSANIVGVNNAIESLEELKSLLNTISFNFQPYAVKEINDRINQLKSMEVK